ncbi:glycosyltransferase family 4 protein [Pseudoalteromonas shioyasakiensis]|uniref:glycosyltransferase family 4 protein n=1 Tax=Pseudoalteromonas shioyasakiensis TaxID=1190813 RepID=UPI003B5143B2
MTEMVFIGTLSGQLCGELNCNKVIKERIKTTYQSCAFIDSNLASGPDKTGGFGFKKLFQMLGLYFHLLCSLERNATVYMTPGLSRLGLIRFLIALVMCKLFKAKVVAHYHGSRVINEYDTYKPYFKALVDYFFRNVDAHIFLSNTLQRQYSSKFKIKNSFVVGNFFSNELHEYLLKNYRETPTLRNRKIRLLYLSNLIEAKGYKTAIEITKKLKILGSDVELKIAGNGSDEVILKLQELIEGEPIEYLGVVSGVDKYELYNESDILLFPTLYKQEGLPLVLLEAMISRLLVVTNNIGGIQDLIVNKKTGLFLEKNMQLESGVTLIQKVLKEPDLYSSIIEAAYDVSESYTEDAFGNNVLKVLNRMSEK